MLTRKQSRLPLLLAASALWSGCFSPEPAPTFDIIANPLTFEFIAFPCVRNAMQANLAARMHLYAVVAISLAGRSAAFTPPTSATPGQ